ncbi:hypothetical protein C1M51_15480 [Methylibium sp. Pch-M]|uniref:hypothetical protein n=1 Tax=Methylibium sp. Pch-M TaxID=2082386 RepID=UPI0010120217|nr:hypothetical protein [Methylibium sp. Pch-M]QAZ40715.1 hypothetical protein C1M51_15480 [Methylibium sp. Pch-M]
MSRNSLWFDERPRHLGWLLLLLPVLAVLLVAVGTNLWRDQPSRAAVPAVAVPQRSPAVAMPVGLPMPPGVRVDERGTAVPAKPSLMTCPYQQLDLVPANGTVQRACVATTRMLQSGDLRSYVLEPQGVSDWTLRIDSGDGRVMAASLSAPGRGDYRCEEDTCAGFSIGPRDAHGGRTLGVSRAVLTAEDGAAMHLSASLKAPGDQQDADLACNEPGVSIVERSGAVLTLCPSGGGGVVRLAHERRLYSLRGAAGDTLLVGVDAGGAVDFVQIGALECQGLACSGVTTQPGDDPSSESGRRFSFSGTTVTDGLRGGAAAVLSGSAVLPPF